MSRLRSRKLIFAASFLLLIILWLLYQRVPRVDLAPRVPASAIGFLEINDLASFADNVVGSKAWKSLAPEYGIQDRWRYAGLVGRLMRATGLGPRQPLILSRSQIAIVLTSIELRGQEVHPRVAFIIETHSRPGELTSLIERRLPELANRAFGSPMSERSSYTGQPVTIYRTSDGNRRMLSAQIGSQWIIANHPEAIEACIDARLGRIPTMANNFYLESARSLVHGTAEVFGFVSADGATRLTNFGAALLGSSLFGASSLAEGLQSLLTDLSSVVSNGVGYGMSFEGGHAVERYAWLSHPQVIEQLRGAIHTGDKAIEMVKFAPSSMEGMTVFRVDDPERAFATLDAVISARLGAAQSFIFRRFVISAREALFGLKENESASAAIGKEMGSLSLAQNREETIWLFTVRDRALLERVTSRFLTTDGASVRSESIDGHDLLISSDERRGAVSFLNDYLAFGSAQSLRLLLEARKTMPVIAEARPYLTAEKPDVSAPMVSFWTVRGGTAEFMETAAGYLGGRQEKSKVEKALADLPLATSSVKFAEASLLVESHSPFGRLPFFASTLSGKGGEVSENPSPSDGKK
jgi:hypothetical protein